MHESSILPDTCVTCGPALPSGLSDGGLSLAHESSILPDTCVTCGPALLSGLSDGGLSLAHESSVMPDTCVTRGLALPSGLSDALRTNHLFCLTHVSPVGWRHRAVPPESES